MAIPSASQLLSLINQCAETQEDLNQSLAKIEALAQVTITTEFLELPEFIIYNYLWALSDIISQAKKINEYSLSVLLKYKTLH